MDRAFPSSQICSVCAFRDGPKPLHVREWTCRGCGTVHDRDDNAAHNVLFEGRRIVAAGRAETLNALWSAGRTRTKFPAQRGEAGSPRKGRQAQTGIPGIQAREHVKSVRRTKARRRREGKGQASATRLGLPLYVRDKGVGIAPPFAPSRLL
ncbi:transposase [Streptomyces sp. NBC_01525]|uniref:zinc ribbon domain-containing protein n=1 Tax=Streptomyces sp. NBC_01525 TaxID=2903893 RepID=UPI00386DB39C